MKTFERQDEIVLCRQFVVVLVDLAKQSGLHPDKILKGTRCFYQDLEQANLTISTAEYLTIIDNTLRLTNRDDLSFILGRKYFPSQLGQLSQAFLNCKNLLEMLKLCQLFQLQIFPFLYIEVAKTDNKTHLLFNSAIGEISTSQQTFLYEFVLSAMIGAIKYRFGELIPMTIKLPYKQVDYIEQYHVHIGNKVSFDQQLAMLTIEDKYLTQTLQDCSQSLKKIALQDARIIRKEKYMIGFVQAVSQFISTRLINHDVSLERCAVHFAMSPATLKRKLAQHKTSYQILLDKIRCQQAIFAMMEHQYNNEYIAHRLQFNDVTNFRRAFKRWTGMTPSAFRASSAVLS
ncbi:AraC family transcriptional regulator ligand-binding domain-containing protein [Psychrosphaera aquimarina]|uniref:AraC family transcriptional regulator ligand-binding domain-containing protein n=1 Tax=Psychrosphaera aquimarina TaxID=2044854 RepID=A0ABU3R350_9GAMM|nr:AraC family transcriptional regulator ligand-binding domain-containing protein [Psychrosphaera aquimarina]MDU0114099.1 AraC family transcriptional regulator ligand-binding domain-containing protein [Psychrosphaera aquimarina]